MSGRRHIRALNQTHSYGSIDAGNRTALLRCPITYSEAPSNPYPDSTPDVPYSSNSNQ
eukprot:gene25918-biopygen11766